MFKPLPLFVAIRYLSAQKKTKFLSFVSFASILGLTLGVAILIIVLSIMNGFGNELQERILGTIPHGTIFRAEDALVDSARDKTVSDDRYSLSNVNKASFSPGEEWLALRNKLLRRSDVEGVAPVWQFEGMLSYYNRVAGAQAFGIDPVYEPSVSKLVDYLVPPLQNLDVLEPGEYRILVGRSLANQLGLVIGDRITFVLPETQVTPAGMMPRYKRFWIAGFFEAGAEIDAYLVFMHWQDAARLLRKPGEIQGLRLKLAEIFSAPKVAEAIADDLGNEYEISDWTATHGTLFRAVKMEKIMVMLLLFLIVTVASFNMVSSFVMLVSEKQADIAILRTMGATPRQIRDIFLLQGVLIGVIGVTIGASLGIWIAINITDWVRGLEQLLGTRFFSAYFVDYLPSIIHSSDVAVIVVVSFSLSLLATYLPARRALLIEPVQALRYE